jgi:hypothetical protein
MVVRHWSFHSKQTDLILKIEIVESGAVGEEHCFSGWWSAECRMCNCRWWRLRWRNRDSKNTVNTGLSRSEEKADRVSEPVWHTGTGTWYSGGMLTLILGGSYLRLRLLEPKFTALPYLWKLPTWIIHWSEGYLESRSSYRGKTLSQNPGELHEAGNWSESQ